MSCVPTAVSKAAGAGGSSAAAPPDPPPVPGKRSLSSSSSSSPSDRHHGDGHSGAAAGAGGASAGILHGTPASSASESEDQAVRRHSIYNTRALGGTEEHDRLSKSALREADWKHWGPYVSERAWGSVREDYSHSGDAWGSFPHDHARSRAYRWNEDGLVGSVCNRFQNVVLTCALWNGRDPILKERLFGLSGSEGNHGEDVKEVYYYLDSTPTHSYMKALYKYPMDEFPYSKLVDVNKSRTREDPEYELPEALGGAFERGHYFDVFFEWAKAGDNDLLGRITAVNCSEDRTEELHILPTLLFRNNWSWGYGISRPEAAKESDTCIAGEEAHLGKMKYWVHSPSSGPGEWMFTQNETNYKKLYGLENECSHVKDAFHEYVTNGDSSTLNPEDKGTKAACRFKFSLGPGESKQVWIRYTCDDDTMDRLSATPDAPFKDFETVFADRLAEADKFYNSLHPPGLAEDVRQVQRQAFAGLLWTKQFYHYGVDMWLQGDPAFPPPPKDRLSGRNSEWRHLYNVAVISMPDCWEYPWYAVWDLAFHTVPLALVDPEWAKRQLLLMLREWYMHPNGQMAAYEWNFSDVNPPVHAWACLRVFQITEKSTGAPDYAFLERAFHKLMLNFTWWVNRKDSTGKNLFEGGFLGLDNIGVFDRSHPEMEGVTLEQADGTAWMAMYCLNMLAIALRLTEHNLVYEDIASKFFEHWCQITASISGWGRAKDAEGPSAGCGHDKGLYDEETGFFYDVIRSDSGERQFIKVKSFVGLIPLFAVLVVKESTLDALPSFRARMEWYLRHRSSMVADHISWLKPEEEGCLGMKGSRLLSLVSPKQLPRILERLFDEEQFLSPHGFRSLSKEHASHPYHFKKGSYEATLKYEPAESASPMYGGNSNWRGPVWFPVNFLMIESLQAFDHYFGDTFKVEYPTGSGKRLSLWDAATDVSTRLISIFLKNPAGKRPCNGSADVYNGKGFDEHVLFYEFFHGDNGAGLGASHQTGWTALVAKLIQQSGRSCAECNGKA